MFHLMKGQYSPLMMFTMPQWQGLESKYRARYGPDV